MSLPSVANETTRAFYIEELRRLKAAIEDFRGKPISDAELHSAIRVYNENRELLNKLYQLRSREKPPISGSEILQVVKAGLVMPREEHNNLLRELLERLSAREGESKGKTRIMVSVFAFEECAGEQPNFIRLMEQMGADVVCDDLCIGHRYFWKPVELKPDPLEALMDRYLGKVPVAYRMSAEERIGLMLDEALKYGARGAVVFIPKYCQICEFHYLYLDEKFKEQGIPTLLIETTSDMPEAPVRTRLQAFIEMLE
jgi:benzoyl-CoA reductase subunit C